MTETAEHLMTTEEFLALPEDGMDRELIRGRLYEEPMTTRNPEHSGITGNVTYVLKAWLARSPAPRGRVLVGEAGFKIRRNPDTTVGIDVAYISPELAAATPRKAGLVHGVPVLAVEILSPSDQHERVSEKIEDYLSVGVALVWEIDPAFRTVRVHRPGREPESFNVTHDLSGEPHLPGFQVPVAALFE